MNFRKLGSFMILSIVAYSCETDTIETPTEINDPIAILDPITDHDPNTSSEIDTSNDISIGSENWISSMQSLNGLLESTERSDFVSLYDNSLTILYFTAKGDFEKAEKTLDFFNAKMETELLSGSGGFYQFRNKEGENGSRTWLGDNAWLLIALNNYHFHAKNNKYQVMAANLTTWIRSLQDEDGGLWGGKNADGTQIHKVTEGIITAFNAVEGYDDFHKNILRYLKNER